MGEENFFRKLFGKKPRGESEQPFLSATQLAESFINDLNPRLDSLLTEQDRKMLMVRVNPYSVEVVNQAGVSIVIFMKPAELTQPHTTALQICNTVYGAEKMFIPQPHVKILRDSITKFKDGKITNDDYDDQGRLTLQHNLVFIGKK